MFLDTLYNDAAGGANGIAARLAGVADYQEYLIRARQLQDFNNALVGPIEVVAELGS